MTLCLYECLRAVGLQHHYASFTSVGIFRAAHLSALTMEDYPILGVRSMEERTRLFHLVQMVKTLDLEYDDNGDDVSDADAVQEGCTVANSFSHDGCGDPDEYEYDYEDDQDATSLSKPSCVRRRLDFNCEPIDYNPKQFSHPEGTVHIYTSHNKNNVPCQGRESSKHVQLDTEGAVVCGYQEKNNHKPDVHQSESHTGSNTVPNAIKGNSKNNSHTRLWPENISFHKPKPRPAPLASNRIINKSAVHNDRKGFSRKGKLYTDIGSNRVVAEMAQPTPVYESKRTAGYNYGLPLSSPPALNKRQPGGQRISVCVRKRPLTRTESRRGEANVVTTPSGECVIVHESKEAVDLTQYILQHKFYFDQVFGEESSNDEVYRRTAYPLVQHMLSGGKATCFAYGQTGAGKTYTMLGSPVRPGLYALAVQDIFAHLSTTHLHSPLLVYVSFFEIYCGQLYDLLDHRKRLFAREDGHKVVHIAGLRNVKVDSVGSVLEVISRGTEERTQGVSGANSLSSRSHALLQIQLRDTNQQIAGRMWFVDLAGSERASDTRDPDKQSRMEGAEINQSLLALKECIRSLDQEQSHTPFRQSKLTQVLKDSFVGDSMTCMIANISPGHLAAEHTLNTLRYADRVKELRGQGGLRGGRSCKTTSSPKRNLSNSSSNSVGGNNAGARGKSPPKKPKLGRQREDNSPTTRLAPFLCSTPKTGRSGEDTSARKGIGLEHLTPVRGLLGCGDKKERWERAGGREGRNRERYGERDQRCEAGLFLEQATDEQINLCRVQRESGLCHREKEIQQISLKGGEEEEEGRRVEPGRGEGSSRYTCSEVDRLSERDVIKLDERDKERKRHLRQYHQQLQQFMPSSASSSVQLFSPSSSYPHQASLSSSDAPSSCSSLPHSSSFSLSALMNHGIEEVLDAYGASVEVRANSNRGQLAFFPSQGISLQTEISPRFFKNENENIGGDSVDGQDLGVSREGTEARCGHDRGTHTQRSSLKVSGEGQVRREEWRTAGMEGGGGRRWVWLEKTQTEQADRMKVERLAESEALVSYNCDSKERGEVGDGGLDASDLRADAVWSNEEQEGADSYSLLSTHSAITSNDVANCPSVESSHQRAPAERPLSPACGHTSTLLTPNKHSNLSPKLKHNRCTSNILSQQMQNARQGVPSSSCREHQQLFAVHANRREISNTQSATLPLTSPTTQNGCEIPAQPLKMSLERSAYPVVHKQTEVKAKMSASLCQDASDSQSYIMDPLSISLLQVDQQVATSSFLEGQQDSTSLYSLENERGREVEKECLTSGQDVGDEDVEFRLSLLELPQGVMKRPIPGVMQVSLQDQENNQKPQTKPAIDILVNKSPAFPLNPSTFAFMQTSDMQSISSSAQQSGNTDSPSSHNLTSKQAPQKPPQKHAFSISTPQSESGLCQLNTMPKQCHTAHLYHSSNISLLTKGPTESNGKERTSKQQVRPMTHLPMLEDLDHDRWRVVQAHWEQLEEMEALHRKEGTLLCQQPDMKFGEYVHKLENIMERKAWCVNNMIAQLQPYLKPGHSNQPHNQEGDNNNTVA